MAFRDLPVDARDLRCGLIPGLADEIRRELAKTSAPSGAAHGHQSLVVVAPWEGRSSVQFILVDVFVSHIEMLRPSRGARSRSGLTSLSLFLKPVPVAGRYFPPVFSNDRR